MRAAAAALFSGCAVSGMLLAVGCGDPSADPSSGEAKPAPSFSMISIAMDYPSSPADTGEEYTSATEGERLRTAEVLAELNAGLLAFQVAGRTGTVERLAGQLRGVGLDYPHQELLCSEDGAAELALLSRFPILSRRSHTNLTYRIQDREHRVRPGILDVDILVPPYGLVRIVVARLKGKVFHPSGQTEMRRNEARILARILRQAGRSSPDSQVLVAALLNDTPSSAPVREVTRPGRPRLTVLRPLDTAGDSWTWYDHENDRYERAGYLLVSDKLATMTDGSHLRILDEPAFRAVSPHRPLMVGFGTTASSDG